ncbi:uncharacterized protein H6S33_003504 [Morchella sextelata]|uniref:uncharacterized protein n=1 Tax=Morchella sextelata TaxID=1174677 RepID=UPI001D041E32|nr:uncharacterized protein H6S33_003504 [Morchella sextelata]KAH0606670.1 hypothetical protein H6S33_003504 [Morchella sextelata]
MAEQSYILALQPYLALAKSATGRAAADLVTQATQAPGVFVFSELLEMPNIQALAGNADGAKYLDLLKIFAYGSYSDYKANATALPPLNPAQLHKLRQLSLITLASQGPSHLTYASLLRTLDLPSTRSLEDLVISSIYASLLSAKLDTQSALVEVSSTAGRDVAPAEIPAMMRTLQSWGRVCEEVLGDLEAQMAAIRDDAVRSRREREEYERVLAATKEQGRGGEGEKGGKGKRGMAEGGEWEEDEMDLDEAGFGEAAGGGGANTSKRRTKGRLGLGFGSGGRRR